MEQLLISCTRQHRWYLYRKYNCGRWHQDLYIRRKEKQQAALKFLLNEVLTYPKWLFDTEVGQYTYLLRNTPVGKQENAPTQILKNAQAYILWDLLGNNRLMRMIENESVNGKKPLR